MINDDINPVAWAKRDERPHLIRGLVDGSGSMNSADCPNGLTRWVASKEGARFLGGFIETNLGTERGTGKKGAGTPLAYVQLGVFGKNVAWSPLLTPEQLQTHDLELQRTRINGGSTALAAALEQGIIHSQTLRKTHSFRDHEIWFIITDGKENQRGKPTKVTNKLKAQGHSIIGVGCGQGADHELLERCSSDGLYQKVEDAAALEKAFMDEVSTTIVQLIEQGL